MPPAFRFGLSQPAKQLLKTCLFTSVTSGTADFVCQGISSGQSALSEGGFAWDTKRTSIMGFVGASVIAPMNFFFYSALERRVPGTHWKALAKKAVASGLSSPVYVVAVFTAVELLKGEGWTGVQKRLRSSYASTATAGMGFWASIGALNFAFVPAASRPMTTAVASMCWNIFLSARANNHTIKQESPQLAAPTSSIIRRSTSSRTGGMHERHLAVSSALESTS